MSSILNSYSPIDGNSIGKVSLTDSSEIDNIISASNDAFYKWQLVPAPVRGELVRLFGEELRNHKDTLGLLVSLETGKILSEGLGEVQEMIDICDFAVGLSRQLYGKTISSERPEHRLTEQWHPLGVVGIISAFNFPVAVWAWNATIALVCGNSIIWKPSEKAPHSAQAAYNLLQSAITKFEKAPANLSQIIFGDVTAGSILANHTKIALVSATGSTHMGRSVVSAVSQRFGKCILELGGNNASIVTPSADLELATEAILFSAFGTAGQRCTSTRRLLVHKSIYHEMVERLDEARQKLVIGSPLDSNVSIGPLIDKNAFDHMMNVLNEIKTTSGYNEISGGVRVLEEQYPNAWYVEPAIVKTSTFIGPASRETFAPILYVMPYDDLSQAIQLQNNVSQGLSSSIFTNDIREAELFISAAGSDCGIANVNVGTSGAEIGGAFGGEKETGGGRVAGSDAWKNYMRRVTNTINYSGKTTLAQGVEFK